MANQVDPTGSNFTYVAAQVGCTSSDKDQEFACMQSANASAIIAVYNKYNATLNGGLGLSFQPAPDNMTDFSNYADRRARGLFAKVPTVYSSVDNEGASLVAYNPAGPNQTAVDALTRNIATCPGAAAALYVLPTNLNISHAPCQPKSIGIILTDCTPRSRKAFNVPVWRTRYFGEWPNLNPLPWLHAYHSSDIPMIFGTSDLRGPDTAAETAMSKVYQNAWAAFARDPENALDKLGWPRYDPEGQTLIKLGVGNSSVTVFGKGNEYDTLC
jgi:carboxylesterase type B